MITHFYKGKGKFRACEDSLTSVIFDLMKYLPSEIFWNVLKKSLYYDKLPEISGELIQIDFWEKWNPNETDNSRHIEPDVFIRFKEFDIIVEAKRYNKNQQNRFQIKKEITAYFNEYGKENKSLYFIQLGGIFSLEDENPEIFNNKQVIMCKTDWTRILNQIVLEKKHIEGVNFSTLNSVKRIFDDLIKGFELHGFVKTTWLSSLKLDNAIKNHSNPNKLFNYAKRD